MLHVPISKVIRHMGEGASALSRPPALCSIMILLFGHILWHGWVLHVPTVTYIWLMREIEQAMGYCLVATLHYCMLCSLYPSPCLFMWRGYLLHMSAVLQYGYQPLTNRGPTRIWVTIAGFRVQGASRYTMRPADVAAGDGITQVIPTDNNNTRHKCEPQGLPSFIRY